MFAVHRLLNGKFKINFPNDRGNKTLELSDLCIEEVHEAANHHFGEGPRAEQHARNAISHCPLCRLEGEEADQKPKTRLKLVR
jgi:hypothetical protein